MQHDRFDKLVYGYSNKIIDTQNDISMCIIAFTKSKDELILNKVSSKMMPELADQHICIQWFNGFVMEIYSDEFTAKLIDYFNEYQIKFKDTFSSID